MNTVFLGGIFGILGFIVACKLYPNRPNAPTSTPEYIGAMLGTGFFGALLGALMAALISLFSPLVEVKTDIKNLVRSGSDFAGKPSYLSSVGGHRGSAKLLFYLLNADESVSPYSLWADRRVKIVTTGESSKGAYLITYDQECDPDWILHDWSFCIRQTSSRWEVHLPGSVGGEN